MSQLDREKEISSLIDENQFIISGFLRIIHPHKHVHVPFELIQIICTYSYHILNANIDINCTQIISNAILIIKNTISCDEYENRIYTRYYRNKYNDIKHGGTIAIFGDIIYNHYNGNIIASETGYSQHESPGQAPVYGPDYRISCGSSYGTIGGRMIADFHYGEPDKCCWVDVDENGEIITSDYLNYMSETDEDITRKLLEPGVKYGVKTLNTLFHGSGTHYLRRHDSTHRGGGTIIVYCNVFINDGLLQSNGDKGCSGGSILIVCNKFYNFGNIQAKGGVGCDMGKRGEVAHGGYGRIAIYCDFYKNNGNIQPDPYQSNKDLNKYYMIKESIKCSKHMKSESKDICIQNKNAERECVSCRRITQYKCWCSRCDGYFCADGYCGFGKECQNCIREQNKTIVINTTIPFSLQ
eukprot:268013_1